MTDLRICFAGTPEFAAGHLAALLDSNIRPVAVYTQPDRPTGRGKKLQPSPVKALALEAGIEVLQPATLKSEDAQDEFRALKPDLLIVVAYGLILPEAILDTPRLGCLNVHASLLPRWRGAAPIERAILAGDETTGVTIMQMDAGLDTGAMLAKAEVAIDPTETGESLHGKLLEVGKRSLVEVLQDLENFQARAEVQNDDLATYASKLDKSETQIHWPNPAKVIDRQIRAFAGRSPAWCELANDRLRILEAALAAVPDKILSLYEPGQIISSSRQSFTVACGDSALEVRRIQLPGKKAMAVQDVMNSRPELFSEGTLLKTGLATGSATGGN